MRQSQSSNNKRKPSGDLSADLAAAGFDFIANLVDLLSAGAKDDLTPGNRARLTAMMSLIPTLYPPQKAIDPTNTMTVPQVAELLKKFAREHGIEGPLTLPGA